jgi:hypothetical protein
MKSICLLSLLFFLIGSHPGHGAENPRFFDRVGEYSIPDSKDPIVVTEEGDWIQFRIRGFGPTDPAIRKTDDWFIYLEDKDHVWVHLGSGRLFYYSWQSDTRSRVDEWSYPNLGAVQLPKPVEDRLKK